MASAQGNLVKGLQNLLALSAEQQESWYEVAYRLRYGQPSKQIIVVHAILTADSDAAFMEQLTIGVETYGIEGVTSWSMPVSTLGYPYQLATTGITSFSIQG